MREALYALLFAIAFVVVAVATIQDPMQPNDSLMVEPAGR